MAYLLDTNVLLRSADPNHPMYNYATNVHDARLTAAMLVHGLTHILTFNISDFARYTISV